MQKAIMDIILRLINDNQKIGITNIQKYINTSADIVEQYISELIAESYLKYDSNKDLLTLTETGLCEIEDIRTLSTVMSSIYLLPYTGSYSNSGYPIFEKTKDLANYLKCGVYYRGEYHDFGITANNKTRIISAPSLDGYWTIFFRILRL